MVAIGLTVLRRRTLAAWLRTTFSRSRRRVDVRR
jgi:hypothetical protein